MTIYGPNAAWTPGQPGAQPLPHWPAPTGYVPPPAVAPPGVYAPDQYRPTPPVAPRPQSEYVPPPYVPAPAPAPMPIQPAPTPVEPPLDDEGPGAFNPEEEDIGSPPPRRLPWGRRGNRAEGEEGDSGAPAPGPQGQRRGFFGIR